MKKGIRYIFHLKRVGGGVELENILLSISVSIPQLIHNLSLLHYIDSQTACTLIYLKHELLTLKDLVDEVTCFERCFVDMMDRCFIEDLFYKRMKVNLYDEAEIDVLLLDWWRLVLVTVDYLNDLLDEMCLYQTKGLMVIIDARSAPLFVVLVKHTNTLKSLLSEIPIDPRRIPKMPLCATDSLVSIQTSISTTTPPSIFVSLFKLLTFWDNPTLESVPQELLILCEEVVKLFQGFPSITFEIGSFVQSISGYHYLRIDQDPSFDASNYVRHLSVCSVTAFEAVQKLKGIHTLLMIGFLRVCRVPDDLFMNLSGLRTLDLSNCHLFELPNCFEFLEHLRYLDLSDNYMKSLPDSMCRLYHLQTLIVVNCTNLVKFPMDMGKLQNLRHLYLGSGFRSFTMPQWIQILRDLQTLSTFDTDCLPIGHLGSLSCLGGSLRILNLEKVSSEKEAKEARLADKKYLDKLELYWGEMQDIEISEDILTGLQPHNDVRCLKIARYRGVRFPGWVGHASFTRLETVTLYFCSGCEFLPFLGQLPLLKSLEMHAVGKLKYINSEFCGDKMLAGFPSLRILKFSEFLCLEEWSGLKKGDMPRLQELMIYCCPVLTVLPSLCFLDSLQHLRFRYCPNLQSLPKEGVPSSLQSLSISSCDSLAARCKKREGEDWCKIERVPNVKIY
ncbi:hypothetical protein GIB67_003466 [Kingdonia uniflora]|uniref:R13L1/DRL21-like LRR repeat region domain-containing protein n=1 Tax=Kingdonia uniflora TaxID=39325 RepID=A0A7J7MEF5_9MAGN|nr:hypothetical protein GIB67_003466 [Kingdonia uniflora]